MVVARILLLNLSWDIVEMGEMVLTQVVRSSAKYTAGVMFSVFDSFGSDNFERWNNCDAGDCK